MKTLGLSLGALALVAAGWFVYFKTTQTHNTTTVVTAAVTRGDVIATVDATGTLQAVTTVQVGTQVSGTIKALHADFNSRVRRGQVIAELEPSLFAAQVEQARASLVRLEAEAVRSSVEREDAQSKLRRARELAARQLIPATDLETAEMTARQAEASFKAAEAQIAQAKASLNQSEVNLAHTIITAPIDGIVISRNVDVGQTVAASMQAPTLFVLARDLADMQVNASIAESDIGRILPGQPVSFRVDAYPGETFTGRVSQVRLEPVVQQNVVSYVTTVAVRNPRLRLKPGMTANVTVEIARATGVLRVPNAALRIKLPDDAMDLPAGCPADSEAAAAPGMDEDDDAGGPAGEGEIGRQTSVWICRQGRPSRIRVLVSIADNGYTAVVAGEVFEGDHVVTAVLTPSAASGSMRSPLLPFGRSPSGTRGGTARPPGA